MQVRGREKVKKVLDLPDSADMQTHFERNIIFVLFQIRARYIYFFELFRLCSLLIYSRTKKLIYSIIF